MSIFMTGTDTDIGKTVASSILTLVLQSIEQKFNYFKPIQTGQDLDCSTVSSLTRIDSSRIIQPVYSFKEPISPNRAAALNSSRIDIGQITEKFHTLGNTLVEGAGGILVPINEEQSMIDLIEALKIKTMVVTSTKLGTLNHTRLTLEALKHRGLPVFGIILIGSEDPGLVQNLEHFTGTKVLAEVPKLGSLNFENLNEFARSKACDRLRAHLEQMT